MSLQSLTGAQYCMKPTCDRVLTKINQFSRILPVLNESDYLGIGLSYDTFSIDFYNPVTFKE